MTHNWIMFAFVSRGNLTLRHSPYFRARMERVPREGVAEKMFSKCQGRYRREQRVPPKILRADGLEICLLQDGDVAFCDAQMTQN